MYHVAIGLRRTWVIGAGLSLLWGLLLPAGQAQELGTFDDDDPDNDPNVCFTVPDPEHCDWLCGWYQAALNLDHVSLEVARSVCPDMQRTDWRPGPPEPAEVSDARLQAALERYLDDDPTNDPNRCFESADPNCDWEQGWHASVANIAARILNDDTVPGALKTSFQSWLKARELAELTDPRPGAPPGVTPTLSIGWFCAPGVEECPRPARQCAPGDDIFAGDCYYFN